MALLAMRSAGNGGEVRWKHFSSVPPLGRDAQALLWRSDCHFWRVTSYTNVHAKTPACILGQSDWEVELKVQQRSCCTPCLPIWDGQPGLWEGGWQSFPSEPLPAWLAEPFSAC